MEEGRGKKEEGRWKREDGRGNKLRLTLSQSKSSTLKICNNGFEQRISVLNEPGGLVPVLIESPSCGSFLYNKVEGIDGRGKKEEGRRKREEEKICLKA